MFEFDVVGERAEQGNAATEQDRDASDGHALDQAGLEEALYGDPAIDVEMLHTPLGEPCDDLVRCAGHKVADGALGYF